MREPPKGKLLFLRRRVLPLIARLSAALGCLLLAAWLVGRILTDDHHPSQYLFWVPTLWVLAVGLVLWLVSAGAGRLALRLGGELLRAVLLIGLVVGAGWLWFVEWRLYPVFHAASDHALIRLVNWNMSARHKYATDGHNIVALDPDIVVITGVPWDNRRADLLRTLAQLVTPDEPGGASPPDADALLEGIAQDRPVSIANLGRTIVVSHLPVLRTGTAHLGPLPERDQDWKTEHHGGYITFIEFDLAYEPEKSLDGIIPPPPSTLVVWLVDLPSDPSLHRVRVMDRAKAAIDGWAGRVMVATPMGALVPGEQGVFPEPDVVIGDFNTPRGSRSIRRLVGSMRDAHTAAGFGPDNSWRQPWAWWGIDQAFVGGGWRTIAYDIVQGPPGADHGLQVVEIVPR